MGLRDTARPELIPGLLREAQAPGGLTRERVKRAAARLGAPDVAAAEAATFYPAFTAPGARWRIRLCKSLSCHMEEGRAVYAALRKALRGSAGEASLERVSCLGLCGRGPAMTVNGRAYTSLTPSKAVAIVSRRVRGKKGRP